MEQLKENNYNVNEIFELIQKALIVDWDKFIPMVNRLTIVNRQLCKNRQSLPQDTLQDVREKMICGVSTCKCFFSQLASSCISWTNMLCSIGNVTCKQAHFMHF